MDEAPELGVGATDYDGPCRPRDFYGGSSPITSPAPHSSSVGYDQYFDLGCVAADMDQLSFGFSQYCVSMAHHISSSIHVKMRAVIPDVTDGVLNLRKGPGRDESLVVPIPAGTKGLSQTGPCVPPDDPASKFQFCPIEWEGYSGWVSSGGLD